MKVTHRGVVFEFECEKCEAQFRVGKNDAELTIHKNVDSTDVTAACVCPCCGAYCQNTDFELVEMDGGYTRFYRRKKK